MGLDNAQNRVNKCFQIPSVAAGTDDQHMLWRVPAAFVITAIYFTDYAGIAADGSNTTVLAVSKGASTVIADWDTTTAADEALTAKTPASVPIETDQENLAAGDVLFFSKTDTGSGKAIDGFSVQIDGYFPN